MTTSPSNQDERRSAILLAAFKLFGQTGYAKATMKDIAAKAGVAQGLIGYHFGTKETLLVEAVREWMLNKGMKAAFAELDPHGSPAEILEQALLHVVKFRKENPEWFTLLINLWTESVNNDKLAAELRELYKEMKSGIMVILDRMELRMERRDQETLASLIQAVFDGLTLQAPVPLSTEPISREQVSLGIGWLLEGARTTAQRKGEPNHE
ncbi:TetR/AcrR family transcriptional regulator [Paenibacillus sp. MWE-103]|uniref:TetR/AcrR family transcriptional regulator n=1 Tax=Paenibacillus artemisiicola TaxID=1172618 RepID=A0ABS3W5R2_9BACL|nr:TetR/AcrR family transcriptional regulator [Paenibacillus artemisiicola]MBO7743485.1 TetR/AcrR family transcriptional regulator [Paenibacillus artemisiicola]